MKKKLLILFLALVVSCSSLFAAINIQEVIEECRVIGKDENKMAMSIWIPSELMKEMAGFKTNYQVFMVIDGDVDDFGGTTFQTFDQVNDNIKLKYKNKTYSSVSQWNVDSTTRSAMNIMKPIMVNMLGQLGNNFHFIYFKTPIDAKMDNDFTLKLRDSVLTFDLPVAALLPKKTCNKDQKIWPGTYKYCPIHGNKLK